MRRRAMLVAASACRHRCLRSRPGFRRRPVRLLLRRHAETAAAPGFRSRRTSSPIRSASTSSPRRRRAPAAAGGSGPGLLRAQLRRQIFSADCARQRLAGADVPGVLSCQRDKGLFRQHHRRRLVETGERYADSENAFAYRKALRADCTCNGRDPAGLAPVDLALDTSLRPGDVIATTDGLVAYSGVRVGNDQTAEFTPVASYPGLTAEVRARLGEMKVAPVRAEMVAAKRRSPRSSARCRRRDGAEARRSRRSGRGWIRPS